MTSRFQVEKTDSMTAMPESTAQRVLILFAHPALEKSRVNRRLAAAAQGLGGVTFHDLYEVYPDFHILADREQRLLTDHDVIVFQFPLFWYSTPALLKEWQDLVLLHGWAFGSRGTALRGKKALFAITAGGSQESYRAEGYNGHTIRHFLTPLYETCRLCGVDSLPPFVVYGTHTMPSEEIDRHASDYLRLLEAIRDGRLNLNDPALEKRPQLNRDLDQLMVSGEEGENHAR